MKISYFIKNGFYIPLLHVLTFKLHLFLSFTICIQLYTINYFFWFSKYFDYGFPKKYNQIKQFINFTYSGNFAMYLYYFFPSFLPICHNIQFIITFGYWVGKTFYHCTDTDNVYRPDVNNNFIKYWSYAGHIVPYTLCWIEMKNNPVSFNWTTLLFTYVWSYAWFVFIYIPWRIITKDPVYSILNDLTIKKVINYLIIIHAVISGSNMIGYLINLKNHELLT